MECTDVLRRDHREVLEVADAASGMAVALVQGHPVPAEDVRALVAYARSFVERVHHRREEEVLFPVIRARLPHLATECDRLVADHRRARAMMEAVEAGEGGLARQGETLAAWARLVRAHTAEEETYLLPIVERSLRADACLQVKGGLARMERPGHEGAARPLIERYLVGI